MRPSSTDGTRYVILATDDEYALVGVRSGFGCSRLSSRSVFDVEDDVLAAVPRRAAQSSASADQAKYFSDYSAAQCASKRAAHRQVQQIVQ